MMVASWECSSCSFFAYALKAYASSFVAEMQDALTPLQHLCPTPLYPQKQEARPGTQSPLHLRFHDSLLIPEFGYGNYQAAGHSKTKLKILTNTVNSTCDLLHHDNM
jgi:hypothetical protein